MNVHKCAREYSRVYSENIYYSHQKLTLHGCRFEDITEYTLGDPQVQSNNGGKVDG